MTMLFNEKAFKNQLKQYKKENNDKDTNVKYEVLNTIELFNKENIYNINMIVDTEDEAIDFVNRVENPDKNWKTITDIIVDVRREKLGQTGELNKNHIQGLVDGERYIELHIELERAFKQQIFFTMIKKFIEKIEKIGIEQVCKIVEQYKERGFSTTLCYM